MIEEKIKQTNNNTKKAQNAHLSLLVKLPLTSVFGFCYLQHKQNSFYPSVSLFYFILLLLQHFKWMQLKTHEHVFPCTLG